MGACGNEAESGFVRLSRSCYLQSDNFLYLHSSFDVGGVFVLEVRLHKSAVGFLGVVGLFGEWLGGLLVSCNAKNLQQRP